MKRAAFQVAQPRTTALRALNYIPAVERMRAAGGRSESYSLGSLLCAMGESYGAVFTRLDCKSPLGIELLSQADMFATEPEGRRIREDSLPFPERHRVRRGQLLLAGAGTLGDTELYGRAILADDRLAGKYVGPDAMVLDFAEPGSDETLLAYAFLCTKLGIQAVRSTSYGTKILRFRPELIRTLPIPDVDTPIKSMIAAEIRASISARERSHVALEDLRRIVNTLPSMQEADELCSVRSRKSLEWSGELPTLLAWTFASTGGALASLRQRWQTRLGDVVEANGIHYGERFVRVECAPPHGKEFVSQRDVFLVRPIPRRVVVGANAPSTLSVPEHALLLAGHGQMSEGSIFGRVEAAASGLAHYAVSEHILRIIPEPTYNALCFAFFSTRVGMRLLQSTAVGTSVPKMRLDLVAGLPIPEIDGDTLDRINNLARVVTQSRREARNRELRAVDLVETEVIPTWLS
jgi:hypothetical protein